MTEWHTAEELFKELDQTEFKFFASALSAYRASLMNEGFTRREAMRLVEGYSKFIYDMSIEDFMVEKASNEDVDEDDDDTVG